MLFFNNIAGKCKLDIMDNAIVFNRKIIVMSIMLMFLYSCDNINKYNLPATKIQAGTAKIIGRVDNFHQEKGKSLPVLSLSFPHPVTAEIVNYQTTLKEDGSFYFEVPLECSPIVGFIRSEIFTGSMYLIINRETILEVNKGVNGNVNTYIKNGQTFTSEDIQNLTKTAAELNKQFDAMVINYKMSPEEYSTCINSGVDEILKTVVENNSQLQLSNQVKQLLLVNYQLYLKKCLFAYRENMQRSFLKNNDSIKENEETFILPPEPGKSYYSFLKYLNLSNPQYLYANDYSNILQLILSNDTLQIPLIKDTPIKDWLKIVKSIIGNSVGENSVFFYDMLVANAYSKQFKENESLSDKQKSNIQNYFSNPSFTDILFSENENILSLLKQIKENIRKNLVVNETPSVQEEELKTVQDKKQPQGKLIDAIVSNYKGKVVVVDFWATWCVPCMQAMKESRELKQEMLKKNVVFVYITNESSPKETWERKIQEIGDEQFYLNGDEWASISFSKKYGFNGIPTYMIFDKKGDLIKKITVYPGNDEMKKLIEELLQ